MVRTGLVRYEGSMKAMVGTPSLVLLTTKLITAYPENSARQAAVPSDKKRTDLLAW